MEKFEKIGKRGRLHSSGRSVLIGAIALCCLWSHATVFAQTVPPHPAAQVAVSSPLMLSTDKQSYHPGDPIWLSITLTNTLSKPITISVTGQASDYTYEVLMRDYYRGTQAYDLAPAHWTAYGERLLSPQYDFNRMKARNFNQEIAPGKTVQKTVLLSRLFDFSEDSTYLIQIKQHVIAEGKDQVFSGPVLTIKVNSQ